MKTELKELSATRKQIDIQIDAAAVRAAYDQISDRYAKAANVPGFRPGHAPRAVVRTRFKDQIRTEVLRELLPEAAQNAIEEHKLDNWEDNEMVAAALATIMRISRRVLDDESERKRLFERICRLDPVRALSAG